MCTLYIQSKHKETQKDGKKAVSYWTSGSRNGTTIALWFSGVGVSPVYPRLESEEVTNSKMLMLDYVSNKVEQKPALFSQRSEKRQRSKTDKSLLIR